MENRENAIQNAMENGPRFTDLGQNPVLHQAGSPRCSHASDAAVLLKAVDVGDAHILVAS